MLPANHLLMLAPNRVNAAANRLRDKIWREVTPLTLSATAPCERFITLGEAKKLPRANVSAGEAWGKLFDQRWWRVLLPQAADGEVFFNWREQGEATLYVDGVPFFGFDVAHRHCRLPKGARELWVESCCVQSAIWHHEASGLSGSGSRFDGAFLCRRDETVWGAYHDLKCLVDLMLDQRRRENPRASAGLSAVGEQSSLTVSSPFYRLLLRRLDEAVNALDKHGPAALSKKLAAAYQELRREPFAHCALTGHAHIDLVWLWPERVGELKATHVFATVNYLLGEYPEFKFAYSQPASYEAVARRAPALYERVRRQVERQRWQATGATYVESDTLIACGEALARSFTLGQEGFATVSGKPSRLLWLPDVFGYSASLPQMMRLSGVDYFFTTKLTWNMVNRFPHSSFVWRGADGSEVVAHVTQDSSYVTHMNISDLRKAQDGHQQADIHGEFLLPTGYGDGGGGPTDEMCERARRLGSLPDLPSLKWEQPEQFFDRLAKLRGALPVHQGECYLECHRGTYTTHGRVKAAFRNLERALQVREAAAVATGGGAAASLSAAWKRMVFAQFHDYIPGSSIPEVYAEALPELASLSAAQLDETEKLLQKNGGKDCVFNPLPFTVRRWLDDDTFVQLPPLTGAPVRGVAVSAEDTVTVSGRTLSNKHVTLTVNRDGAISSLSISGKDIVLREPLGRLTLYPDVPAHHEAWDLDRHTLSLGEVCNAPAKVTVSGGGNRATISVSRKIGKHSRATVSYTLEAGGAVVNISVELDWHEPEHLLKINFPTGYAAANARFGIPYGSILRPQQPGSTVSEAMWEVPFSRWLAVFDEGERDGLFIVSEDKYGATVRDGTVGVSLARNPRMTGCDAYAVRPPALARLQLADIHSDSGAHRIRLDIGAYDTTAPLAQQPAALAESLYTPPMKYRGAAVSSTYEGVEAEGNLLPAWALPADGGAWILRLNETAGRRGRARLKLSRPAKVTAVDLLGRPLTVKKVSASGEFDYRPYEIISLRIEG